MRAATRDPETHDPGTLDTEILDWETQVPED